MFGDDHPPSALEQAPVSIRDRTTIVTCGILLVIAAAGWIVVVSSNMGADEPALEAMEPSLTGALAFVVAWAAMMTAMMLPSALPMIALYGAIQRKAGAPTKGVPAALFTLVYLALWALVGVPVYLGGLLLASLADRALAYGIAGVLVVAGIYQFTPLKHVCLRACRSPLGFLLGRWRAGVRGSLALGWAHAAYCLGCCWALMIVLVAAGAMGIVWVLLIAAVVAAEKLLPGGDWIARAAGGALVLLGVAVAIRPDLVMILRGPYGM